MGDIVHITDHAREIGYIAGIQAALGGIGDMIRAHRRPGGRGDEVYIEALNDVITMMDELLAAKRAK